MNIVSSGREIVPHQKTVITASLLALGCVMAVLGSVGRSPVASAAIRGKAAVLTPFAQEVHRLRTAMRALSLADQRTLYELLSLRLLARGLCGCKQKLGSSVGFRSRVRVRVRIWQMYKRMHGHRSALKRQISCLRQWLVDQARSHASNLSPAGQAWLQQWQALRTTYPEAFHRHLSQAYACVVSGLDLPTVH